MTAEGGLYLGRQLDGRWRVDTERASGGFSIFMEGTDLSNGRKVGIKLLRIGAPSDGRAELDREIALLSHAARCDRVVDILGSGKEVVLLSGTAGPGIAPVTVPVETPYIVLELADGCLTDLMAVLDKVSWAERLNIFRDVAKATHQLHLKNIYNRDIKSENVLLFSSGSLRSTAKITDLGRARRMSDPALHHFTDYLAGRGDLRFAPPELLWHQGADTKAYWSTVDLYHLGSVLFELATGVALTPTVIPDPMAMLRATRAMSTVDREREYRARIPELRARMELGWELFDHEVPKVIRRDASALLRQITDPDWLRRSPQVLGRPDRRDGLLWLLRRADILRLSLANAAHLNGRRRHYRKAI
jgi:serine/threonine protein kinase